MSAKYWVQTRAPSGNYSDSLGTDDADRANTFAIYLAEQGETVRVVRRTDEVMSYYSVADSV